MKEPSGKNVSISDIIRSRRTIHNFKRSPVPEHKMILKAIDLARWAPNHHVTEPWHFYLLGQETADRICRLNADITRERKSERAAEIKLNRWRQVPGWLVLTCMNSDDPIREREDYAACCCAAQNLMLLLWDEGIGIKWTTGDVTKDDRFYELINVERQRETVVGLFWYGYAEVIPDVKRKPVATALTELP
ncbi:MAG: nitroreductase [Gammaproteobacteria bacterium]